MKNNMIIPNNYSKKFFLGQVLDSKAIISATICDKTMPNIPAT